MKKCSLGGYTLLLILLYVTNAFAWGVETHASISEYAVDNSALRQCRNSDDILCGHLDNIGFVNGTKQLLMWDGSKQEAYQWLREGAKSEDEPPRWVNHFHDPLRDWGSAGLGGSVTSSIISSSVLWAQDSEGQDLFNERTDLAIYALAGIVGQQIYDYVYEANDGERDWSWPKVREYFYTALTSSEEAERDEYFAMTFRGVGHQMHLLEDMAVPEHVRNDGHGYSGTVGKGNGGYIFFETWGGKYIDKVNKVQAYAPQPVYPEVGLRAAITSGGKALAPITQFSDTEDVCA